MKLTFSEKAALLTGVGALSTHGIEKHGIKAINMSDGPAGVRRLLRENLLEEILEEVSEDIVQICNIEGGDTCIPTASAIGASWSRETAYRLGQLLARDCIKEDIQLLLAPAVNMKRTPLNGRNFEYFSEDPILSGELAAAYINGLQDEGVGTSLKHFIANNQEENRDVINNEIDERTLRELYLRVFEVVLSKSDPVSVMCAYNKVNGIFCSENKYLLNDILKEEWGYKGCVISDWGAVHNVSRAIAAGLHLEMPHNKNIEAELLEGIKNGIITEKDVDNAVEGYLKLIDDIKELSKKQTDKYERKKQHEIAVEAAVESITLLKNQDNILPIDTKKYKKIGVLGLFAEKPVIRAHGGSGAVTVLSESVDSPLDYIRKNAGEGTEIIYEPLYDFMSGSSSYPNLIRIQRVAAEADITIMFIGTHPYDEAEGRDRLHFDLPKHMAELADEVCRFSENSVIIMQTGVATAPFINRAEPKAIIQMWYSGEGGGRAIADILFGRENPSGKLSETFMKKINPDLEYPGNGKRVSYNDGVYNGYRYYDSHPEMVWYPFGFGLSYTSFSYSDLKISPETSSNPQEEVVVSLKVKNTGERAGKEVVQLYIGKADSIVSRPQKDLRDFEKIHLMPGEEKEVSFKLNFRSFAYYNTNLKGWHAESGNYEILAAASSTDIRLKGNYNLLWDGDYTIYKK